MGRERSNSSSSNKKTGSNQSVRGTTREGYFGIEGRSRPIVAELAECAELERRGVLQPIGLFFCCCCCPGQVCKRGTTRRSQQHTAASTATDCELERRYRFAGPRDLLMQSSTHVPRQCNGPALTLFTARGLSLERKVRRFHTHAATSAKSQQSVPRLPSQPVCVCVCVRPKRTARK